MSRECMLIDTHIDTPYRLCRGMEDISRRTAGGHFDYVRAREGGLDAAFMAAYIPADYEARGQARAFADYAIGMVESFPQKWPGQFIQARSVGDVKAQRKDHRISVILAMENGAPLEGDLANVRRFYDRGVRYLTLCHAKNNHICDSSFDSERTWRGLSPFGKELVTEMNRVGMIIDISHVSDDAFYQVIERSDAPVLATHSSCRHFTPGCERNMSDDMIRRLARKGGVIGINFGAIFLNAHMNKAFMKLKAELEAYIEAHRLQGEEKDRYVMERRRAAEFGKASLADVVAHIDHAVQLAGIDHVGIGSDFDGVLSVPEGLTDVSCYPNLKQSLIEIGYSDADIAKIWSENVLRVWTQVDAQAA